MPFSPVQSALKLKENGGDMSSNRIVAEPARYFSQVFGTLSLNNSNMSLYGQLAEGICKGL